MFRIAAASCLLVTSVLIGCKKDKDKPNPPPEVKNSLVEVVHASPRTGEVEVKIGDVKLPSKIKYLDSPAVYSSVPSGNAKVQLSSSGATIAEGTDNLINKFKYTLFIYDTLDAGKKVKYLLVQDTFPKPATGKCNIRLLHVAPKLASVDVDLFKGTDSLRLAGALAYAGTKAPDGKFRAIASGDYHVKVKTKTGTVTTVVLDIPSMKLEQGKTYTVYLNGLMGGTGNDKLGLKILQQK
jgi:hypothetical protein